MEVQSTSLHVIKQYNPDSKILGDNMGPTWVLSAPDGPHVGPMNLAIRGGWATVDAVNTVRVLLWILLIYLLLLGLLVSPLPHWHTCYCQHKQYYSTNHTDLRRIANTNNCNNCKYKNTQKFISVPLFQLISNFWCIISDNIYNFYTLFFILQFWLIFLLFTQNQLVSVSVLHNSFDRGISQSFETAILVVKFCISLGNLK